MKSARAALVLALFCAPALAGDGEPAKQPPAPAPAPAPAAGPETKPEAKPAKKERQTSPEAEAVFKRYSKQLAFPPSGVNSMKYKCEAEIPQLGGAVKVTYLWTKDKEASVEVDLPDMLKQQVPPQMMEGLKKQIADQLGGNLLESVDSKLAMYNLTLKDDGGKAVVEVTQFDEKAPIEKGSYHFDAGGLLVKQVSSPRVDPDNPQAAMMAGGEIETIFTYVKRGDLQAIGTMTSATPMGDTSMNFTYFDAKEMPGLLKQIEINAPMMPEPITVSFHDWEIDGKAIAGTEAPAPKPAAAAEKKAEAPAPAPTPAPAPAPAPGDNPPAPKQDAK